MLFIRWVVEAATSHEPASSPHAPLSRCVALQLFVVLVAHKPEGRRWVSKEQYIGFFMLAHSVLCPDSGMSEHEQRCQLQVTFRLAECDASAPVMTSFVLCRLSG